MSLALKSETGDLIFFDVVTNYSKKFTSNVTQHPVDGGGTVSDHVVKSNPVMSLRGYLTGADFNYSKPSVDSELRARLGRSVVVGPDIATPIAIEGSDNASRSIPSPISQFFTEELPRITNLNEDREGFYSESGLLQVLQSYWNNKQSLTLYEFDGDEVVKELPESPSQAIYITNLSVDETAEEGDALMFNITLEVVTLTYLLEEEIPEAVRADIQAKAKEEANKGGQQTESEAAEEGSNRTGLFDAYLKGRGGDNGD